MFWCFVCYWIVNVNVQNVQMCAMCKMCRRENCTVQTISTSDCFRKSLLLFCFVFPSLGQFRIHSATILLQIVPNCYDKVTVCNCGSLLSLASSSSPLQEQPRLMGTVVFRQLEHVQMRDIS